MREEKGNILQRDKETYAIVPRIPAGVTTPEMLRRIADVAEKYCCPIIKITGEQRIALVSIKEDQLDQAWKDLGEDPAYAIGLCMRGVKACPGNRFCKYGVQDSIGLALELEKRYYGLQLPAKFKMAVSGCPFSCPEPAVKDIGAKATRSGFTVMVGGTAGGRPRLADTIAERLSPEEVLKLVDKIINFYKNNAKPRQRIGRFIDEIGLENFKQAIL